MLTFFEERKRVNGVLYKVTTTYLLGIVPLFRFYVQLTVKHDMRLSGEEIV